MFNVLIIQNNHIKLNKYSSSSFKFWPLGSKKYGKDHVQRQVFMSI